jgi:hypothetical protein
MLQLEEQLNLDLFEDVNRWPRRPYCTNDLAEGLRIRSLSSALRQRYIQANPPHLRVWSIHDVDRPGAAIAWETAGLPPPSWAATNRMNGHAHLVWGLRAPVLVEGLGARDAPMRYLCAVESMMRARLQADTGYSGLITKNPSHPLWRTLRGPVQAYDLEDLAEYLPDIEKHFPRRRRVEEVGLGRNVTLFDRLRHWAYRHVREYRGGGLQGWNAWLSSCNSRALIYNGDFQVPLLGREVWHIAKSVAKWCWQRFDEKASDARFSQLQAYRGRKGGRAKGLANEDKRATARLMASKGMTQRAIAGELGIDKMTVNRWLKATS